MARKSRKNLLQPEQATVSVQFPELDEEKIPTAIYGRLSVEDDEDNESMETQIALVQDKPQTAPRRIRGCVCDLCGFYFAILRIGVKFQG